MNKIEKLIIKRDSPDTKNDEKDKIDDAIAFEQRDVNHSFKGQEPLYELAKIISSVTKTINKKDRLSFDQDKVFQHMMAEKNLWISAKTSFGKTWLSYSSFLEKARVNIDGDGGDGKPFTFIHVVPSEIIEAQIKYKINKMIKDTNNEEQIVADNKEHEGKYNYIVGTPEKIYPQFKKLKTNVKTIIVDEAHEMFFLNERSKYFKLTIEEISKHFQNSCLWFIGAFLNSKNQDTLNVGHLNNNLIELKPKGFKSHYLINYRNDSYLKGESINEITNVQSTGITLNYFSSTDDCRSAFDEDNRNISKYIIEIARLTRDDYANQQIRTKMCDELDKIFNASKDLKEKTFRYDVLDGLRIGKALYHAKMPMQIKTKIFEFAEKGLLNEIYSTSSIISGLDLDISTININKTKMGKKTMEVADFLNLSGRTGRYKFKKRQELGIVNIAQNAHNNNWFYGNKTEIMKRPGKASNPSPSALMDDYNITQSIHEMSRKDLKKEYQENLYIDPRIHPEITKKLTNNIDIISNIYNSLKNIFNTIDEQPLSKPIKGDEIEESGEKKWSWDHEEIALKSFKPFLDLYTNDLYKFKNRAKLREFKGYHIRIIRNFLKYVKVKDENILFTKFSYSLKEENAKNDSIYSDKMTRYAEEFYNEIKYALYSYVSHFLKIAKKMGVSKKEMDDIMHKEGNMNLE